MKALIIDNGELSIQERPDPHPSETEVVVRVAAAGLNGADILQRRGLYPAPEGAPQDIPGLEFAGEVVALGSGVTAWKPGRRVMGIAAGGAQAEYLAVDETHLLALPAEVDDVAAGGFPEAFATAHDAIVTQGRLRFGERLLVTGAAGGVGSAGVQIGHLLGASVTASVRDGRHGSFLAALGADEVIAPDQTIGAGPFDVVLELVGAASLDGGVLRSLATDARVVVIGVGGGAKVELNLLALMAARASISASTLRARSRAEKAYVVDGVRRDLLESFGSGQLRVPIEASYPLEQATEAYDRFAAGGKAGKIVLTL
jgi:NADPH:quinone reductase-like Zn-dependent oxidoreductase